MHKAHKPYYQERGRGHCLVSAQYCDTTRRLCAYMHLVIAALTYLQSQAK